MGIGDAGCGGCTEITVVGAWAGDVEIEMVAAGDDCWAAGGAGTAAAARDEVDGIDADAAVDADCVMAFWMLEIMSFIVCCMGCTTGCGCGCNSGACGNGGDTTAGPARVSNVGPIIEDDVIFTGAPEVFCSVKFISARLVPVA